MAGAGFSYKNTTNVTPGERERIQTALSLIYINLQSTIPGGVW